MLLGSVALVSGLTAAAVQPATGTPTGVRRFAESIAAVSGPAPGVAVGVTATATMTDLDDTPGKLDLASVQHHAKQLDQHRVRISYRLQTVRPFRDGLLQQPRRVFIVELHRDAPRGADRNITVASRRGTLVATVISNATRELIARVPVHRVDPRTISVEGPRRLIGARSFFAYSNFHDGGSAACGWYEDGWPITCQDSVPDDGWIPVQRLGWPV
jgi:hypothetical protein